MERNNLVPSASEGNELVATWGNLCQRPRRALGFMLSFAYKRFDGKVPEPGDPSRSSAKGLDDEDQALLAKVEAGFQTVGDLYNACHFRAALGEALALAREANGDTFAALSAGLDRKAPWFQIKEDPQAAATSVYVILRAVDNLKTILAPILPHTPVLTHRTQKLHEYLGYEGQLLAPSTWSSTRKRPATAVAQPQGIDLRSYGRHRRLGEERIATQAASAPASAALQKAGRERDRGGVRAAGGMRGE